MHDRAAIAMDAAIFGLIVADLIAATMDLRQPPPRGGLQIIKTIDLTTGGNVCNTGIAMAKLGMQVAAAGLVGNDGLGSAVSQRLINAGVDASHVFPDPRAQTSATVVAVEYGGERCFFHVPGVTELLDALKASHRAVGLATGNMRRGAELMLSHFHLWDRFAAGNSLSAASLAQALWAAGAETAMQLDINNPYVLSGLLFPQADGTVKATKFLDSMPDNPLRFLKTQERDFMYVTLDESRYR
jgi:hypothetical protein